LNVTFFFAFQCFESLVIKGNLNDMVCMKAFISKGLGLGIVVGSSLVKLPQVSACGSGAIFPSQ
jgi:mannose-P-dolichol utilization defect protein 1